MLFVEKSVRRTPTEFYPRNSGCVVREGASYPRNVAGA